MPRMKTPGVYIVEKNAFPNSVIEVPTAVPAFVGYTEAAADDNGSLHLNPRRLTSMVEFTTCFGGAARPTFAIGAHDPSSPLPAARYAAPDGTVDLTLTPPAFCLHAAMRHFYVNGGGDCYVVSVGGYNAAEINADALIDGIAALAAEAEPTLLVVPETTRLSAAEAIRVQQAMLDHCGRVTGSRFAILDLHNGHLPLNSAPVQPVDAFRNAIGTRHLGYGAVYYPWVNATLFTASDCRFDHLDTASRQVLADQLSASSTALPPPATEAISLVRGDTPAEGSTPPTADEADQTLRTLCPLYVTVTRAMAGLLNAMPPGAAMAGIYTMVDNSRGVWKAPANVSVSSVSAPMVAVDHREQEDLNVSVTGKSVNAIRPFTGEGTLVWGARTLDGNSLDWRYINVRRTMIMLEQSIKKAMEAYVFEPNTSETWITLRAMIENFLTSTWKAGGLAGTSSDDAFSVKVGLGETMTPQDILEGILRMTVMVAVTRPAEFIALQFSQQMQKS